MKLSYLLLFCFSITNYCFSQKTSLNNVEAKYFEKEKYLTNAAVGYFYDVNRTLVNCYLDYSYKPENLLYIHEVTKGKKLEIRGPQLITRFGDYKFTYVYKMDKLNGNHYQECYVSNPLKEKVRLKDFKGPFQKQLIALFPSYNIPKHIREQGKLNITDLKSITWLLKLEYSYKEGKSIYLDDELNDVIHFVQGKKNITLK